MSKSKILFLTSPEHGQANVQLAVISSLRKHHGNDVEVYLSSFESLRPRVPEGITFKPVPGRGFASYFQKIAGPGIPEDETMQYVTTSPGFVNGIRALMKVMKILHPETPEEYVATTNAIVDLIDELKPTLVVADNVMNTARDALMKTKAPHVFLSPNTLKEVAGGDQGLGVFTWPAGVTAYPYPLPWYLYIPNALALILSGIWFYCFDKKLKALNKARQAAGFNWPFPIFTPRSGPTLCVSHPAADYKAIVPDDLILCGPILQASPPLQEVDPELNAWISARPTVLIVLGSHFRLDEHDASAVMRGVQRLLEARPDLQVLWKLQKLTQYELGASDDVRDRLRIVHWLNPDPISILWTGKIVCFVNHGGSNSYHEALATGSPQVILSPWYDCHDFGNRAEWLGIGKWGNKNTAPHIDAGDFTEALLAVVGATRDAPEAARIRTRARELGQKVMKSNGKADPDAIGPDAKEGREVAADYIWKKVEERLAKTA